MSLRNYLNQNSFNSSVALVFSNKNILFKILNIFKIRKLNIIIIIFSWLLHKKRKRVRNLFNRKTRTPKILWQFFVCDAC